MPGARQVPPFGTEGAVEDPRPAPQVPEVIVLCELERAPGMAHSSLSALEVHLSQRIARAAAERVYEDVDSGGGARQRFAAEGMEMPEGDVGAPRTPRCMPLALALRL